MNRRGIFIGTGAFLLVVGAAGLALLQTGAFDEIVGPGTKLQLEAPPPETLPKVTSQAGQSRVEGKVPTQSNEAVPPAPQAGSATAEPAEKPSGPPEKTAEAPQKPQEDVQAAKPVIPPVLKGERRYPSTQELAQPPQTKSGQSAKSAAPPRGTAGIAGKNRYAARQSATDTRKPVAIRFVFDPAQRRDLKIAKVRMGDRIVIKVRRLGPAQRQIYLGFDLPERTERRSYPYYGRAVKKSGTVITTIRDSDQFTLRGEDLFSAALSRRLDSKEGAVMKLGAKPVRRDQVHPGASFRDNGRYEVEVRIYSGNRWNIRPRSLL